MKNKMIIFLSIILVVLVAGGMYYYMSTPYPSKTFSVIIEEDSDYTILETGDFILWSDRGKKKLIDYIKKRNPNLDSSDLI